MLKLKLGAAVLCALMLAGCGGGSLGDGETTGSTTGGTTGSTTGGTTGPEPATLTVLASSPQLSSNASAVADGITLTAIVKDKNQNVVPNVAVQFGTSDSAEINVINATTDANGRAAAVITTGGDPQNRSIEVTTSTASLETKTGIDVVGTTLSVSGVSNTQIGVDTPYTILLTDSAGNGIAGKTATVTSETGNTVTPTSVVTNAAGQATVNLNASKASSTVMVSVLGMTASKAVAVSTDSFTFTTPTANKEVQLGASQAIKVRWLQSGTPVATGTAINFTATRGVLSASSATTDASGYATVNISSTESGFSQIVASSSAFTKPSTSMAIEFVAVTPASLDIQASPAVLATNQSSEISAIVRDPDNNLVKNATVDFSLSDLTGGTLSAPNAVTNSQGLAKVTYLATSQASASRNVTVTGKVHGTSITDAALLTVGARAVSITLGTGAQIASKDTSTYQDPWTVLINDSAGNPVPNAEFTLSIQSVAFLKGTRAEAITEGSTKIKECPNEDINLNDIVDSPNEDTDHDGILEPGRVATVPTTITLDPEDGTGQFFVTYPKEFGNFVKVRIIAVAHVAGTETTESREFWLSVLEADVPHLPPDSPFGTTLSCTVH